MGTLGFLTPFDAKEFRRGAGKGVMEQRSLRRPSARKGPLALKGAPGFSFFPPPPGRACRACWRPTACRSTAPCGRASAARCGGVWVRARRGRLRDGGAPRSLEGRAGYPHPNPLPHWQWGYIRTHPPTHRPQHPTRSPPPNHPPPNQPPSQPPRPKGVRRVGAQGLRAPRPERRRHRQARGAGVSRTPGRARTATRTQTPHTNTTHKRRAPGF
jgi:hypothetical protein